MSRAYSHPERADDRWSLPDVEIFYMSATDFMQADEGTWMDELMKENTDRYADDPTDNREIAEEFAGWYYWYYLPGCLPDSDPVGPFKTEQKAYEACIKENK